MDENISVPGPDDGHMHGGMSPHQEGLVVIKHIADLLTILIKKQWPTALDELNDPQEEEPTD